MPKVLMSVPIRRGTHKLADLEARVCRCAADARGVVLWMFRTKGLRRADAGLWTARARGTVLRSVDTFDGRPVTAS